MGLRSAALVAALPWAAAASYETKWHTQSLTHAKGDDRTYQQRYLVNDTFWGKGSAPLWRDDDSCPGPVLFFYSGNEGPVDGFWPANGFMTDYLAPKWGAYVLMAEARYYGASLPFGNASWTPENVQYLSTELILADYARLLTELKSSLQGCPVVSFGGSYGGTLTTFFRLTYPDVVVGGLAASAPIGYYDPAHWKDHGVDAYTFSDIIARDYDDAAPGCLDAIRATTDALNAASPEALVDLFHLCDAAALGPTRAALWQYALESLPQLDYPRAVGSIPAWPVNHTCHLLARASTAAARLRVAAEVQAMVLGTGGETCFPALVEGPGGVPGDGPGPDSWGYQSCTENLHEFSSKSKVRDYTFDFEAQASLCGSLFDDTTPDPRRLTALYGGYEIPAKVTNVIFSNGLLDPWHGGGFYPSDNADASNVFCVMPKGAHHGDLRKPEADDPADIKACRALEEATIGGWLAAAVAGSA
ncbi:dipeptidyl-peptidase [Aureococcus anophagefferens]|nr:dipeptidyl-peptidase [Aureococcus anophagefferens]